MWSRTVIESPFKGDIQRNLKYVNYAYNDCLRYRQESPFASHKNYTDVLDDTIPEERMAGIQAGLDLVVGFDRSAFYLDYGFSSGMRYGLVNAIQAGREVTFREFFRKGLGEGIEDLTSDRSWTLDVSIVAAKYDFEDLLDDLRRAGMRVRHLPAG